MGLSVHHLRFNGTWWPDNIINIYRKNLGPNEWNKIKTKLESYDNTISDETNENKLIIIPYTEGTIDYTTVPPNFNTYVFAKGELGAEYTATVI